MGSIRSTAMLAEITGSLHRNTSFSMLDISDSLVDEREQGGRHIGDLLRRNRHLTRLNVAYNRLGALGGSAMANGLSHNRSLKYLDCSMCDLGDVAVTLLAVVVASHPAQICLIMSGNGIKQRGIQGFAQHMIQHTKIFKWEQLTLDAGRQLF
jgi:Ran GTPase-activating protein (RanGAP) involved in mRNA processing and transport